MVFYVGILVNSIKYKVHSLECHLTNIVCLLLPVINAPCIVYKLWSCAIIGLLITYHNDKDSILKLFSVLKSPFD